MDFKNHPARSILIFAVIGLIIGLSIVGVMSCKGKTTTKTVTVVTTSTITPPANTVVQTLPPVTLPVSTSTIVESTTSTKTIPASTITLPVSTTTLPQNTTTVTQNNTVIVSGGTITVTTTKTITSGFSSTTMTGSGTVGGGN